MATFPVLDAGYASYYDEADEMMGLAMGRIGAIVSMGALGGPSIPVEMAPAPTAGFPVSGQAGQISSPAQIATDAANLRTLGYYAPSTGNAYDPKFRSAVAEFQADVKPRAGTVDGLIGPTTRSVIAAELAKQAAGGGPVFGPPAPPAAPYEIPSNPLPGPVSPQLDPPAVGPSGGGGLTPAKATEEDQTMLYVGIGAAVLAAFGLAYYATK